eukprot:SAG31_NODE_33244_length_346_cov_0.627530_1_plen_38_part_10
MDTEMDMGSQGAAFGDIVSIFTQTVVRPGRKHAICICT